MAYLAGNNLFASFGRALRDWLGSWLDQTTANKQDQLLEDVTRYFEEERGIKRTDASAMSIALWRRGLLAAASPDRGQSARSVSH